MRLQRGGPASAAAGGSFQVVEPPSAPMSPFLPMVGGFLGFASTCALGFAYMSTQEPSQFDELVMCVVAIVALIVALPAAIVATLAARRFRWRSPRAMWLSGMLSAALLPLGLVGGAWVVAVLGR